MTLQEYLIHAYIEYWHWHNTSMSKRCYRFFNIMGDSFVFVNIYIKQDTLILFEIDSDCFQNTPLRFLGYNILGPCVTLNRYTPNFLITFF